MAKNTPLAPKVLYCYAHVFVLFFVRCEVQLQTDSYAFRTPTRPVHPHHPPPSTHARTHLRRSPSPRRCCRPAVCCARCSCPSPSASPPPPRTPRPHPPGRSTAPAAQERRGGSKVHVCSSVHQGHLLAFGHSGHVCLVDAHLLRPGWGAGPSFKGFGKEGVLIPGRSTSPAVWVWVVGLGLGWELNTWSFCTQPDVQAERGSSCY